MMVESQEDWEKRLGIAPLKKDALDIMIDEAKKQVAEERDCSAIIKTITDQWDGNVIPFPEAKGLEHNMHMYLKDGKTRAFIVTYKFDEDWNKLADVRIDNQDFRKIMWLESFFHASLIIAVEFKDKQMFAKARNLLQGQMDMVHDDGAFLPKERFQLLRKTK